MAPLEAEFIKFILSRFGQNIVEKDGYVPLSSSIVTADLVLLGLSE